ncbi:MAG: N-acetylglucosamine kinase [Candidatus Rokuibacteriota bacterium]
MTAPICVGVEGGGTHTTALAVTLDGSPVARRVGAAALIKSPEPAARLAELESLVRHLIQEAGSQPPVAALCCALAGVGREHVRLAVEQELVRASLADKVSVITDAEAALQDAFGDGPGVLLISGTGSIAWGRDAQGRPARVGGWGILLGDEGSGYAMGLAALRAIARADDGRAQTTALTSVILARFALQAPSDLIAWTDNATKAQIAAIAPAVLTVADRDDTAATIVNQAADALVSHLSALLVRLAPWTEPPRVALAGGTLAAGRAFRSVVERVIREREPGCLILTSEIDGARGATAFARKLAG